MKKLLPILALLAPFALPVMAADEPAPAPAAEKPEAKPEAKPESKDANNQDDRRQQDRLKRMVERDPELKGVDPSTPEGQEKIRESMRKRFETDIAPQIRQRIAEAQAANHARMQEELGIAKEDFAAIEPLITRVEQLRQQKGMIDLPNQMRGFAGGGRGGRGGQGGPGGGREFTLDPKMFLGDTAMEPAVQECQDARKALKALLKDKQSNAAEVATTTARLRKGAAAFQAALDKAQAELKAVLTPRQEAQLVADGLLD